jgi:hypothetical protein
MYDTYVHADTKVTTDGTRYAVTTAVQFPPVTPATRATGSSQEDSLRANS